MSDQDVRAGYKQTEVGVIPEDWDAVSLGNIGAFKNGINKPAEAFGYGFPFVNLMDVFGVDQISTNRSLDLLDSSIIERKHYDLRAGDVLFIRSSVKPSGVGLTTVIKSDLQDTVFSGFLLRFRDRGQLAPQFKRYCFFDTRFRDSIIASSTVSANTNINQSSLKKMVLAIPPSLREQRAIAGALSDADGLIAALEEVIAKKRDLKQAAMQQLLTGKTRLPGFSGDWAVKRLGDACWFQEGPGVRNTQFTTSGVKLLNGTNIYCGSLNLENTGRFISLQEAYGAYSHFMADEGDIVLASSGITIERLHEKVAFVRAENLPFCMNTSTIRFKVNASDLVPEFLFHFLTSDEFKRPIGFQATGSAQLNFGPSHVTKVEIRLPALTEQTAIAEVLSDMDADLAALEARAAKARAVKQGMMQQLLTGKVRLI